MLITVLFVLNYVKCEKLQYYHFMEKKLLNFEKKPIFLGIFFHHI